MGFSLGYTAFSLGSGIDYGIIAYYDSTISHYNINAQQSKRQNIGKKNATDIFFARAKRTSN